MADLERRSRDLPPLHQEQHFGYGSSRDVIEASDNRLKGVYPSLIQTQEQFLGFQQSFNSQKEQVGTDSPYTRLQYRALLTADLIGEIKTDDFIGNHLEAVIPLDLEDGSQYFLGYFSHNDINRVADERDSQKSLSNFDKTSKKETLSAYDLITGIPDEYQVMPLVEYRELSGNTLGTISIRVLELYKRFGWDSLEAIQKLLSDPDSEFAVAVHKGEIVSLGMAETAKLHISDMTIHQVEITEASSDEAHEGKGLYKAVSQMLMLQVAQRSLDEGVRYFQFSESNALSPAVLSVVRRQGRTFVRDIVADYGLNIPGFLSQQVPIKSDPEQTSDFNDLFVNFTPYDVLISRYWEYQHAIAAVRELS